MAPKSKAASSQTMKQGTLSFGSAKRGAQATAGGKTKTHIVSSSTKPQVAITKTRSQRSASASSTISLGSTASASQDDDDFLMQSNGSIASVQRAVKRLKTTTGSAKAVNQAMKTINIDDSSEEEEGPQTPRTSLDEVLKSKGVNKLYIEAKHRMGDISPIHAENQTKANHILRVFDLSYEYGPCIGMTRLQRWQRAESMGLKPPTEVLDILKTEEAKHEDQYRESVFYDAL